MPGRSSPSLNGMASGRRGSPIQLFATKGRARGLLAAISSVLFLCILVYRHFRCSPDYSDLWQEEEEKSVQLEKSGQLGRLVSVRQLRGAGFNNQVQETLILSYLVSTLSPSHTYVPPPIYWQPRGLDPIPLSAFLVGLPPHPSDAYFRRVCPEPKRVRWEIPPDEDVVGKLGELLEREQGERCLVVEGERVLQWSWLETDAFLDIWNGYSRDFLPRISFSPRVLDATERSIEKLGLGDLVDVLAVHLRRGDFASHCPHLFENTTPFTGWNRLIPPPSGLNLTEMASFMDHCYHSIPQMVATIETFLSQRPSTTKPIRTLYVAHDFTHKPWLLPSLRALELQLLRSPRSTIRRVRSSGDHHLPWQERDLLVAVDMKISRRAGGGFIANGWSSLSAAVVGWREMGGGKGGVGFW